MSYGTLMSQTPSTLFSLATLHITGPATGSTVTVSSTGGGGTQTAKEVSSGVWEIEVDKGNWTVKSDGYEDGTVSVGSVKVYDVVLSIIVSSVLEGNSWKTISIISQQGKASQYWSIGDKKSESFYERDDRKVYTLFYIADFDHDAPNSITFAVMHFDTTYGTSQWDERFGNNYLDSTLYSKLVNVILPILPCKNYIREVTKQIIVNKEAPLKIFSFSQVEVFGSFGDGETKGSIYPYFRISNNKSASTTYISNGQYRTNIMSCWGRTWFSRYNVPFSFNSSNILTDNSSSVSLVNGFGFVI